MALPSLASVTPTIVPAPTSSPVPKAFFLRWSAFYIWKIVSLNILFHFSLTNNIHSTSEREKQTGEGLFCLLGKMQRESDFFHLFIH